MIFRVHCWVSQPALSQADELDTMGRYASELDLVFSVNISSSAII